MNNQFVIGVEFGTNPVGLIIGENSHANGIAADLFYNTHCKVGLFCNIYLNHFPQHFSYNTKRRKNGANGRIPPAIFECQAIFIAAMMVEEETGCLPDYFSFLLGHPLIKSSSNRFLNDSRKLNNIWN